MTNEKLYEVSVTSMRIISTRQGISQSKEARLGKVGSYCGLFVLDGTINRICY